MTMTSYLHYDVFTSTRFEGNQLAVFPEARGMSAARMQTLTREMNFSESTFILPADSDGTDVRMRIFTPMRELPMAGHPTIGSTFALVKEGVIKSGQADFVFGLGVGPTPVDLDWDGDRLRFAWMTQPLPTFGDVVGDRSAAAAALGLSDDDLSPLPVQRVSCGVPYLLVPLRDRAAVDRAVSDAAACRRLADGLGESLPIFLFALGGLDPAARPPRFEVYSRMFAPGFGIIEDPATGSASGPLGCYLVRHRQVTADPLALIVSDQGVAMGRASRIHVAIAGDANAIAEVKVGGEAVLVGRGELFVERAD